VRGIGVPSSWQMGWSPCPVGRRLRLRTPKRCVFIDHHPGPTGELHWVFEARRGCRPPAQLTVCQSLQQFSWRAPRWWTVSQALPDVQSGALPFARLRRAAGPAPRWERIRATLATRLDAVSQGRDRHHVSCPLPDVGLQQTARPAPERRVRRGSQQQPRCWGR